MPGRTGLVEHIIRAGRSGIARAAVSKLAGDIVMQQLVHDLMR